MSFKQQHISYWIISGCFLLLTTFLFFKYGNNFNKQASLIEPFNVTTAFKATPGRYYQINGLYHLDMTGTSQITLPLKHPPENIGDYELLIVNNLNSNQAVNIYLTAQLVNSDDQPPLAYRQKLINNRHSVNELNQVWHTATKVSEVALVIESEITLGFGHDFNSQVSWQSIRFDQNSQISQVAKIFSELTAFVPLNFSSVNVHNGEAIAIYKPMLTWLGGWLLISVLTYIFVKPAPIHLISSVALAWLIATLVYGYNFSQQIESNQQRFSNHTPHLNQTDRNLSDMAKRIDQAIVAQPNNLSSVKIMILGGEKFNHKRLNYHLLQYNVGVIDYYEDALKNLGQQDIYVVLLPPYLELCEQPVQKPASEVPVILLQTTKFCLIQP